MTSVFCGFRSAPTLALVVRHATHSSCPGFPCGTRHLRDTRCCVVHVVQRVLNLVASGEKLFQFNGTEFRRVLCRLFTSLGHNEASQFTLKGFRAGRAASLAASGTPLERSSLLVNGNNPLS